LDDAALIVAGRIDPPLSAGRPVVRTRLCNFARRRLLCEGIVAVGRPGDGAVADV